MYCKKCGKEITNEEMFCPVCGTPANDANSNGNENSKTVCRCLPSFILGLIGGLFGMFGGICTTMCSVTSSSGNSAFIFIFLGAVIGLVGACLCFTKAKIGSILEGLSAFLMIVRAFSHSGATFSVVIGLLFMLVGAIIGIIYSFFIKNK